MPRVRTLDVPGAALRNVYYLRSLDDSKAIRQTAEKVKRAVVIGSGFIGMEVASVLAQKGIEVTMILREDRIWKHFFSPQMSRFFESYYTARRVRFVKKATVKELRGEGAVTFGRARRRPLDPVRHGGCGHWSAAGYGDARRQRH